LIFLMVLMLFGAVLTPATLRLTGLVTCGPAMLCIRAPNDIRFGFASGLGLATLFLFIFGLGSVTFRLGFGVRVRLATPSFVFGQGLVTLPLVFVFVLGWTVLILAFGTGFGFIPVILVLGLSPSVLVSIFGWTALTLAFRPFRTGFGFIPVTLGLGLASPALEIGANFGGLTVLSLVSILLSNITNTQALYTPAGSTCAFFHRRNKLIYVFTLKNVLSSQSFTNKMVKNSKRYDNIA